MIFHDFTKNNVFQNIKIKLNSTTWMTLECSVVIFQALEYLWPQWPQQPQQPQQPQWPHRMLWHNLALIWHHIQVFPLVMRYFIDFWISANSQLVYENKQATSKSISSSYVLVCLLSPSVFANYFLFKRDKMPLIKPKYIYNEKNLWKD